LREVVPGVALGTDIIVGFPGETAADFAATADLVQRVRFEQAFIFVYSPRAGTQAAKYLDTVPAEVKKERVMRLQELQYNIAREINAALVGKREEILVEGPSKTNPDYLSGRTRSNKIVIFPGASDLIGHLTEIDITSSNTFTLFGLPASSAIGHSPATARLISGADGWHNDAEGDGVR
jgi:tRNA-2-methylthio-N6-dimethylallyladenosine synthase